MLSNWKHLRVPFQLTLAPLFLWGALLSGVALSSRFAAGFVAFHFLLYTGITAFNSHYDRDEGPVGGLENPPETEPSLLPLALCLKAVGLAVSLYVGAAFAAIYATFLVLSFLYSHPAARWKANPIFSTLVVTLGQGGLGFLAGWAAARGGLEGVITLTGALGAASAALTTLGMYPITQAYQMEDDLRRGDRTLTIALGPHRALRLSQAAFTLAGTMAAAICWMRFGPIDAVIVATAYASVVALVEVYRARLDALDRSASFRAAMRMLYGGSAVFSAFILAEWLR